MPADGACSHTCVGLQDSGFIKSDSVDTREDIRLVNSFLLFQASLFLSFLLIVNYVLLDCESDRNLLFWPVSDSTRVTENDDSNVFTFLSRFECWLIRLEPSPR